MNVNGSSNNNAVGIASKVLSCIVCGEDFIFSSGEMVYYLDHGLAEPKRCPSCRRARRAAKALTSKALVESKVETVTDAGGEVKS